MDDKKSLLLAEILPQFAVELEQLLGEQGEARLASQVEELMIVQPCGCGDGFCASFYTQAKPQGAYGPGHRCIVLEPAEGMLILDVVLHKIAFVEVLNRNDIREKLLAALP